jgi:indole-3-glycerol phosphate synthase
VLIGINNRDLRTFTVSLDTTVRLAGSVPPGRTLVSESGIESRDDVERMALHGVDAVLVGEGILRSSDIGAAVRALVSPTLVAVDRPGDRT